MIEHHEARVGTPLLPAHTKVNCVRVPADVIVGFKHMHIVFRVQHAGHQVAADARANDGDFHDDCTSSPRVGPATRVT